MNIEEYNLSETMRTSLINRQFELLNIERSEKLEFLAYDESFEESGLTHLFVFNSSTKLFGSQTFTLFYVKNADLSKLPSHSLSLGNPVDIFTNTGYKSTDTVLASGVISKITGWEIEVTVDEKFTELRYYPLQFVQVQKSRNEVSYERILMGFTEIQFGFNYFCYHLLKVLFKESEPSLPLPEVPSELLEDGVLGLFNENLNESQIDAVKFALTSTELAVIHGPPGTGKTTALVEIILQHVKLGKKVLAVAPSNQAVDNLVEKLMDWMGKNIVRIGHPVRTTQKARQITLAFLIQNSNDRTILKLRKQLEVYLKREKRRGKSKGFNLSNKIENVKFEIRKREWKLSKSIMLTSQVVLTTVSSIGNFGPLKLLRKDYFDLTVIDECSQSIECACYMAVTKSPKLLIAGDHKQLPPTVLSKEAAAEGLKISLMERVIDMYDERVTRMLKTQYRMNSGIMNWASEAMYEGQLRAHESVCDHLLCHMNGVARNKDTENALILIDTEGTKFEKVSEFYESKSNEGEAAILVKQVKKLIMSGVQESDIGVISPYNRQVTLIKKLLRRVHPAVEVQSIDGFQGREKEAILISLVRSNDKGEIGFLTEDRRLNVAVTRARRQLTLVCDSNTVCRHPFIKTLVDYMSANGVVTFDPELEYESDTEIESQDNCDNLSIDEHFNKVEENLKSLILTEKDGEWNERSKH